VTDPVKPSKFFKLFKFLDIQADIYPENVRPAVGTHYRSNKIYQQITHPPDSPCKTARRAQDYTD
jgi:hypothetical protein